MDNRGYSDEELHKREEWILLIESREVVFYDMPWNVIPSHCIEAMAMIMIQLDK